MTSIKFDYFKTENFFQNLFELLICVSAIWLTVDTSLCTHSTGSKHKWQWSIGAMAICLTWIMTLVYIETLLSFLVFFRMYKRVLSILLKMLLQFSPFLVAFALSFHFLLGNQYGFSYIVDAATNTFAMFSGEINAGNALFSRYEDGSGFQQAVPYVHITYIYYIGFILLIFITLNSLVTGVAVGDVESIRNEELEQQDANCIKMVLSTRSAFSLFSKYLDAPDTYSPSNEKHYWNVLFSPYNFVSDYEEAYCREDTSEKVEELKTSIKQKCEEYRIQQQRKT